MIASLRGILAHNTMERLIIDVGGVGYDISFCQSGLAKLPEIGEEVFLHVYTKVREDAIELYGFAELTEKEMFVVLLSVSGVGPKVALGILSMFSPAQLARAVMTEELHTLTKLPGIGKKTAERLCLELKDKVNRFVSQGDQPVRSPEPLANDQLSQDVVSALVNLGYPPAQAKEALRNVRRHLPAELPEPPIEEFLRLALRSLA